jgi:dipeptidase D
MAFFREIATVPRQSKKERKIAQWLEGKAGEHGFNVRVDDHLNVVIQVPGNRCVPDTETLVLQGHTDMVCEKTDSSTHDFENDSIEIVSDGDWITARETTLGADNGIAIALALDIATDQSIRRPPLELVFTSDEEQGMSGAKALTASSFSGRTMINIDSEDEGMFTVGCAGGLGCVIELPYETDPVDPAVRSWKISVTGLAGGHSGVDINKPLANANQLLARALASARTRGQVRIAGVAGGSARNAIPRSAEATIVTETAPDLAPLQEALRTEYPMEAGLELRAVEVDLPSHALGVETSETVSSLLAALPSGVQRMSQEIPGLVETSCNLATVTMENGSISTVVSCRSSVPSALSGLEGAIRGIAHLAGGTVKNENAYPAWKPRMDSALLEGFTDSYRRLFGKDPVVEVIHAGLECGVIGEQIPDMDMISVGPTIKGAHSPDERLHLPSVEKIRMLLIDVLESRCGGGA